MYSRFPADAVVVQKYGGTSVGSVERIQSVAQRTKRFWEAGHRRIAVVVSAMSGETNRLVELVRQTNPDATPKSYDLTVAAGEQISVGLLSAALEAVGLKSEPLLGHQLGIFTDENHSRARIKAIDTDRLHRCWAEGKVPVVAGFQGVTPSGEITTLGRGGSDTSAVALAAALGASFCEINTDVDGFYTADPRYHKTAYLIPEMSTSVALELAALGSKVLHSRCVELAEKFRIPLVVRNTFSPDDSRRTYVLPNDALKELEAPVVSGLTLDRNVTKVTVSGFTENKAISDLFLKVGDAGVNVDIIVHDQQPKSQMSVGFTIFDQDIETTKQAVAQLGQGKLEIQSSLAKVSAVGLGMRAQSGVAARMLHTLSKNGIEIVMISTSEIKISCVIAAEQADQAVAALHTEFLPAI